MLDVLDTCRSTKNAVCFFLKVLPNLPSRPVNWVTETPVVETVLYPNPSGETNGQLYRPPGLGPHPGIVVCLGVVPFEENHPQVPRLGDALARAGFAALLYWSPAMRDVRLDPEDIQGIALAYRWLIEQPFVRAESSGLLGTCVGGSFALMAAADATIRDRIAFVTAWAPYVSLRMLAIDVASASTERDGVRRPWAVDQLTRRVYVRSMTEMLEPEERERMRSAYLEPAGTAEVGGLSPWGKAVLPLLGSLTVEDAIAAIEALPAPLLDRIDAMSPERYLADVGAPLVLLAHDVDDAVIPIAQSRRLVNLFGEHPGVRYPEFTMFKHLDPSKVKLSLPKLALELARFFRAVQPLFQQATTGRYAAEGQPPGNAPEPTAA